jgi:hypothetical protein
MPLSENLPHGLPLPSAPHEVKFTLVDSYIRALAQAKRATSADDKDGPSDKGFSLAGYGLPLAPKAGGKPGARLIALDVVSFSGPRSDFIVYSSAVVYLVDQAKQLFSDTGIAGDIRHSPTF